MSTAETRHIRILVVDDDPEILALARDILGAEGYSVLEGAGGEDALRVAKGHAGPMSW